MAEQGIVGCCKLKPLSFRYIFFGNVNRLARLEGSRAQEASRGPSGYCTAM